MAPPKLCVRCPVPGCKTPISRRADILRHSKTHTKAKNDFLYCCGCPYRAIQQGNLEIHIKNHHTGKERYRCKDPSGCDFGANSKGAISNHRGKHHKQVSPSTLDVIMNPTEPVYERASTVESSDSSLSYTSASPATTLEENLLEGYSLSHSSLRSPSPLNIGPGPFITSVPSQAVATGMEQFRCAPVEISLQHGDERVFPEPKVLHPATYMCSALDIQSDDVLPQGGCSQLGVNGSLGTISTSRVGAMYSYGSVTDVTATSSVFDVPIPVRAPGSPLRYQQDPRLVHPVPPPHLMLTYSSLDPMGSTMDANILNMPFSAYNPPGPSGYRYQPQLDSITPVQHSVPSGAYPASYQHYQMASWNDLSLGTSQQPMGNAIFTAPLERPWMSDFSMQPLQNDINRILEFASPAYASEPRFSDGAYDGYRYH
ncbi:hypothetical protein F5146DRAFT_518964 [Armillaria mellea]|nr:hypothetical protein F5146DRAFT_518964 [Armillaria mellea]